MALAERGLRALAEAERRATEAAFRRTVEARATVIAGNEEASAAARELVDAAAAHLRASGVAFSRHEEPPHLVITPGDGTPLNELARELRGDLDTALAYRPSRLFTLAQNRSDDIEFRVEARYDSENATIDAPHDLIADLDVDNLSLRHETIHADTHADLRRGHASPYHSEVRGSLPVDFCGVSLSMTVTGTDELRAYGHVMDVVARELKELLAGDERGAGALASTSFEEPYCSSRFAEEGSAPVEALWASFMRSFKSAMFYRAALDGALAPYEAGAQRAEHFGGAEYGAWVWLPPPEGMWPRLEVRLAASSGADDPKNHELLVTQYEWIRRTVNAHLRQLAAIEEVVDEIRSASPAERAVILCALPALTAPIDPDGETHPDRARETEPAAARRQAFRERRRACAADDGGA